MDKITVKQLADWNKAIATKTIQESLVFVFNAIPGKKVFSTSFGIEDQVLSHELYPYHNKFSVFTLDTGRQFEETYAVFQKTSEKYSNYKIDTYFPEEKDIKQFVASKGINGFYNSIENRKECCFVRKVKPLKKALQNVDLWITGLRAEQSANRESMHFLEWDEDNQLLKFNPLLHVTIKELENIIAQNNIPMNSLFKKGYKSIGCEPCTRAIAEGENFRAGRWWWENGKKECGLHIANKSNN